MIIDEAFVDKFISNQSLMALLDWLKHITPNELKMGKLQRALDDYKRRFGDRFILGGMMNMEKPMSFVGRVDGRGSNGRYRTVLVKDIHLFGIKVLPMADHMWVRYSKAWEKIEPFIQGQMVMLYGRVIEYERRGGDVSYTVESQKVIKL